VEPVSNQPRRFYDGGEPGGPTWPDEELRVELERRLRPGGGDVAVECFRLRRRIAYNDRHCGEIVVPVAYDTFETDLVSVPALFTWLVPKTGAHLPAALIHDGLVGSPADRPTYRSTGGHVIGRVTADRVFRDGMADTGTGLVRRWLVWTAVTLATMVAREDTSPRAAVRTYYRCVVIASLVVIGILGYLATADLFDASWWPGIGLPWMGDRAFFVELVTGVAGAIVVPIVIGLLWGPFRRAAWIAGVGVAVLIHVTVGILAVTALYNALEWAAAHLPARLLLVATGAVVAGAMVIVVLA